MSEQGRCVANQNDEFWYTFGDGHLTDSADGIEHVIDGATASLRDFLGTFVAGIATSTSWQTAWSKLPAYFDESVVHSSNCDGPGEWKSLRTVSRPAQAVSTFEIATVTDDSIYQPAARNVMVGVSREWAMTIPLGYRVIQNRIYFAVGTTVRQIGQRAALFEYGYLWQIGTSNRGLLTHEIGLAQFFYYSPQRAGWDNYYNQSNKFLYAINVEAGRVYLRLQAGPAYAYDWGVHVSTSIGWVGKAKK